MIVCTLRNNRRMHLQYIQYVYCIHMLYLSCSCVVHIYMYVFMCVCVCACVCMCVHVFLRLDKNCIMILLRNAYIMLA